ncbi:hypothetical protein [Geoglobus acetivorans]|uniref:Uncharacterized protein n=1 Tax=Geoglobus acetivorans TaxID=565033 RepID=A0A0A7GDK2_GEOAI|nr:hypothetical protein GACE_0854 [Geoglobus acetivorans]
MTAFDRDAVQLLGELNGKVDRILCELQKISDKQKDHEDRLDNHDRVIERHSTYFRVVGFVVSIIVAVLGAIVSFFKS